MKFTASVSTRYSEFKFASKPDERVRTCLKGHGYRWSPRSGAWWKNAASGYADCITGLQLLGCVMQSSSEWAGDSFDMAYEDACRDACGL